MVRDDQRDEGPPDYRPEAIPSTASGDDCSPFPPPGDATRILSRIESGDPSAAQELLPLVYEELRKLAAAHMARDKPGQTLQATALVHEAYIRLVDVEQAQHWNSRGHFFGAAAEAMRRILVETARGKARHKRGGDWKRVDFEELDVVTAVTPEQLLDIDDAVDRLGAEDQIARELVRLRYFAGLSLGQAAALLKISPATAYRHWAYARAWLRTTLLDGHV
jgi:RNA polymerase sigma factor (TIGR02999 family)